MSTEEDPSVAFAELFANLETVQDQIDLIHKTFDELMATVDATEDQDDEDATLELVVAAVGSVGVALRVLAKHLEDTGGT